jgi:hypothetical protein
MKHYKPGQSYVQDKQWLRAKKREAGCKGCVLNTAIRCPRIASNGKDPPACIEDGIIFIIF